MIEEYAHPYVTVDAIVFRFYNEKLQVLLTKRADDCDIERGKWSLPGGFCSIDMRLDTTLEKKLVEKTGISTLTSGFYYEQLKTYDGIDRDLRGRIISVAYLCLTNDYKDTGKPLFRHSTYMPSKSRLVPSRIFRPVSANTSQ